ncbi:MAG: TolC family protein [Brevinema sp.]
MKILSSVFWCVTLLSVNINYAQELMDPKKLPESIISNHNVDIDILIDKVAKNDYTWLNDPAANTNTWTLNQVINMAALNNKAIQQSKKDMDSTKALYIGSIQDFYVPTVSVGAAVSVSKSLNPEVPAGGGVANSDPVANISVPSVNLSWKAFNGLGTMYAYRIAVENHRNAALTYTNSVRTNMYDAVIRYYEQFLRDEDVIVILENINFLRQQLQESEVQFRNGRISDLDLNTARANYYNALPQYYEAERNRFYSRMEFYRFIGYKPQSNETILLSGSLYDVTNVAFTAFNEEESLDFIYSNDTRLASLRSAVSNAASSKGQVNAQRMPTVELTASFSPNYGSDVTIPTFGDAQYRSSLSATARLTIPLTGWIPGTGIASQVKSAEIKRQNAEIALQDAQEQRFTDLQNTLLNIRQVALSVEALRISESNARRAAEAAIAQYRGGRISLIDYNQTLQTYLSTRQSFLTAIYNDLSLRLGLQQAIQPLPGFINEVNRIQDVDVPLP